MKINKKINLQYTFTVEGNTEKWYLDHLQSLLNRIDNIEYSVKIIPKVEKSPLSFSKRTNAIISKNLIHLCDVESKSPEHLSKFNNVLRELNEAKSEKHINYNLGYSNYTFELWIILHKMQLSKPLTDRTNYLQYINSAYSKNFITIKSYKEEKNFKGILKEIDLEDVKTAIKNAETIEKNNLKAKKLIKKEYGCEYFLDNPSLSIHKHIKQILVDCKIYP